MTSNNNEQGVTRVAELENLLSEVLDMYHHDYIEVAAGEEFDALDILMDRIQTAVASEDQDPE